VKVSHRFSCCQLVEQRLGVFQVGGVEALGEPVVDFIARASARLPCSSSSDRLGFA